MAPERASEGNAARTVPVAPPPPETDIRIIPDGQVRTTPQPNGRFLVEIGRARYVKRFNLSGAEAAQVAAQLAAQLGTR
jgi:hypothetical protein